MISIVSKERLTLIFSNVSSTFMCMDPFIGGMAGTDSPPLPLLN